MQNKLKISFLILFLVIIGLSSCKKKKICAAYNSYFVFDQVHIGSFFTPFGNDSIPGQRKIGKFNNNGLITKSRKRKDEDLINYTTEEIKKAGKAPGDSLINDDSTGAVISMKEMFPEKINTDQEAYDHYVGELLKKYQEKNKRPAGPPDSTAYYKNPPPEQTKEEKKEWKRRKKAYKKRKKEEARKEKEEAENKESDEQEEEFEESDEFDFDLEEDE